MKTIYILLILSASLFVFACQERKKTIRIATKPMTEQFILGEMIGLLIEENTDLKVEITKGIGGGTSNIHPALVKGKFDLYPEYTGTGWLVVLKKDSVIPSEELYKQLSDDYERLYRLKWVAPYGFNNAYSLAVSDDNASRYGLKTYSDLAHHPRPVCFWGRIRFLRD